MTTSSQFERTTTEAVFVSTKSLVAHTEKLPSEEPSAVDILPNTTELRMDLILANQQTIMANQHALEKRMDKMENLMLQLIRALQKGDTKGNQ